VVRKIKEKRSREGKFDVQVHYFEIRITGGNMEIKDPDHLIYEIKWQSLEELESLLLSYPEDRDFLVKKIKER